MRPIVDRMPVQAADVPTCTPASASRPIAATIAAKTSVVSEQARSADHGPIGGDRRRRPFGGIARPRLARELRVGGARDRWAARLVVGRHDHERVRIVGRAFLRDRDQSGDQLWDTPG